ncbi:hypothetical protein BU23DRAFT_554159 [Bimuria novae-zelandiae CBS 107.79]|uniref:VanZ-like domain-containing protein n=1 Tax=Bimuria novae-zelandiae CBS 107.79 TaxID=1447943 RepID=A0A6A5V8T1_9PLEO|nr:hypothetical protein BU23DRAFT_554159 [Bimuria novae-zelandiae CBS 107.79]
MMRIRKPFAAAFAALIFISAAGGFAPPKYNVTPTYKQSDKALHFVAFFLLTLTFYWILETSRRKVLQLTFMVVTLGLGVASEVIQGLLPIDRQFDYFDIVANVMGSLMALSLCNWYHKRMLERKRAARGYGAVAGDDHDVDIELGESRVEDGQESGIARPDVERELDNWDENAEDWETTEPGEAVNGQAEEGDLGDSKKRED